MKFIHINHADYIFDCRGKPEDFSEEKSNVSLAEPKHTKALWSRFTTPDGWTIIHHLPHISKCWLEALYYQKRVLNFLNMFDVNVK